MIEGFSSWKHLHSLSVSRSEWGMHRKYLQTSNLQAGHTHTQSSLPGGMVRYVTVTVARLCVCLCAHNDRWSKSFWIQCDVKYVWPPGGRLWHGNEAWDPADKLWCFSPTNNLPLSLYYFPSHSISILSLKVQQKDFTGAKPFKQKELV